MITLMIVFIFIAAILYGVLFGIWIMRFNRTGSKKFNFLSFFPFELNGFRRNAATRFLDIALLGLGAVCSIVPITIFAINEGFASSYILMGVYYLMVVCFLILLFTKLSNYRPHVLFAVIFGCLEFLFLALCITFFSITNPEYNGYFTNTVVSYVVLAIALVQFVFQIVLFFNPSRKGWAKMVKIDAETFARPKYNYMAGLEWGTFLNLILNYVIIVLVSCF